jgi:hypothetical protein
MSRRSEQLERMYGITIRKSIGYNYYIKFGAKIKDPDSNMLLKPMRLKSVRHFCEKWLKVIK